MRIGQLPLATEDTDLAVIVTAHPHVDSEAVFRAVPTVVALRRGTRAA
jgi:hypothetical protein